VACLALIVAGLYLSWRLTATLNLSAWWVSVPLWFMELHAVVAFALFVFTAWDVYALPPTAPVRHVPGRIAVLVPTYNEPFEVLLPTVSAAVAIRLEHETWLLDDGHREWVCAMADELGVRYVAREVRSFAKAGNINAALEQVDADHVVVLDADHVAAPDSLTHTLGYFEDPTVAMVQTPQDFYNDDSFEHDSTLGGVRRGGRRTYCEQGLFYRVLQPGRNRWNAAFSCGSNSVFRVSALRDVGGFAVESITEDIHTSLRLHRRGWRTAYHDEVSHAAWPPPTARSTSPSGCAGEQAPCRCFVSSGH
jgi:cellulose synthase (UDP-forming)